MKNPPFRHKLLAVLLGLLLSVTGAHRLYLRSGWWWLFPVTALPLIGYALRQPIWFREPAAFAAAFVMIFALLDTIRLCLIPAEKWDQTFNADHDDKSPGGALPIIVAIVSLMVATILLATVMALAVEGLYTR